MIAVEENESTGLSNPPARQVRREEATCQVFSSTGVVMLDHLLGSHGCCPVLLLEGASLEELAIRLNTPDDRELPPLSKALHRFP